MKVKRQKRVGKYLNLYCNKFGFRPPYQVLVDGTFCHAALNSKVNIKEQLPKYLNSEVHILTTSCAIQEIDKLGTALRGATTILKQYHLRKCGHEKDAVPAAKCLLSLASEEKNTHHYFIATQDSELSEKVRKKAYIPLLYLHYNAMILEKPSNKSLGGVDDNDYHMSVVKKIKDDTFGPIQQKIFKKKKKNPNPLSCLKKKKKSQAIVDKNKRKCRKKKRIPGSVANP